MNSFIESSRYQIIYLEGYEVRKSNCSIAMGYYYKNDNPDSSEEFMSPNLLEDAFYRALQDFPILAGHLKTDKHSRMYIEVDEYNLNMPVYTDTTCDLEYSDIEKAGFNLLNLPIDLYGTYGVPVPSRLSGGKIKPINIRILRFKNNSGVLVYSSIIHCVMDGYGYVHFMNRWAEVARWMQQQQQSEAGSEIQLQEHKYAHNRAIPNGLRSDEITPSTWETVGSIICRSNVVSRWIAKLSPEKRGWLFKMWKEEKNHTYCFFHIPSKTIQDLRNSVQKHAPPGVKYSINDILTTCLAIAVVEAKQKAKADKKGKLNDSAISKLLSRDNDETPTTFKVMININVRPHVDHPDAENYMGNMTIPKIVRFPYDLLQKGSTVENIATLAEEIRDVVSESHVETYGLNGFLLDFMPEYLAHITFFCSKGSDMLKTSNHSRFAHYEVDFGSGAPALVRHASLSSNGFAYIMPTNPKLGGYEVELKLSPEEAENIIQNTGWMKLVDSYNCYTAK